jgi:penicillin-binding protein 1A
VGETPQSQLPPPRGGPKIPSWKGLTTAQKRLLRRAIVLTALGLGCVAFIATGVLLGTALAINVHLPPVDALYTPPSEATRIYAADGQLIASLFQENRNSIPLSQIPRILQRAVIDAEDADFYHHHGFSPRGVLRAGWRNVRERGYAEGGSTITQQLARNLFLTSEKSLTRKIAEILLAIEIERQLTKEEILERYLNQVYFGQGAYGVETAAELYFGKPASALALAESALLAGLIKAPSLYSPYEHLDRGKVRMAWVLQRMVDLGDITSHEMRAALAAPIPLTEKGNGGLIGIRAPYFVSYILPQLLQRYGEEVLYKGGLRVYTSLDLNLQQAADAAIHQGIDDATRRHLGVEQGALMALDPRTGYLRAMIGGYDFRASQFNRVTQANRPPGSVFKVFTYTAALMRGIPLTKVLLDEPLEVTLPNGDIWEPQDFDPQWHGPVTMRYALENSINVASIRLEQEVGAGAIVNVARRMGITSPIQQVLSLTLGSNDMTLFELVSAYGVLANGGVRAAPIAVLKVTDWRGKILEEHVPQRQVVLSPEVSYLMTDLMKGVVRRGTGVAANIGIPEAGKTGTTDDFRNAWFIGFTPSLVAGVWVGNDDNSTMEKVVGGGLPAQIWTAFMRQATAQMPMADDWPQPDGIVQATVCGMSGLLATPECPASRSELFIKGTEPDTFDLSHGTPAGTPTPRAAPTADNSMPLTVTAPRDGGQVGMPFLVQGTTRAGATVHIAVESTSGAVRVQAADLYVRADQFGNFSEPVSLGLAPAGGTLTITVTATLGSETESTTLSVQEQ